MWNKMRGGGVLPPRPSAARMAASGLAGGLSIAVVAALGHLSGQPWVMAPFGASAVILFALPDSPLAQPRNLVGGHVLSALVGLLFLTLFGPQWWAMAAAVGCAIAVMQAARALHPPAGANPLVVMLGGAGWSFLAFPVLAGALAMLAVALVCNNLAAGRRYPLYWGWPSWRAGS